MPAVVLGISGNIGRPSKTRFFVEYIGRQVASRIGATSTSFDIEDIGSSLPQARRPGELDIEARNVVEQLSAASVLVVGSPTFKGSYTGLFKHFFDLLDPSALRGKPVILAATGGGERHALMIEHQLRPLFGFFEAQTMPTAIYASNNDFADGVLVSEVIKKRVAQAVSEVCSLIAGPSGIDLAA